ncbi:transposase [Sphingobium xenophagum]|uniref:transposase n=1 Tax=Sphingobium xenophagum TaxID=121428 RepID=UPI00036099C7|nr:transposase [Sphingobium xenophagum]
MKIRERIVDFERFPVWLVEGLDYGAGTRGGRPPFYPVSIFKIPIVQAQHNLSDARLEYMIRARLSYAAKLLTLSNIRRSDANAMIAPAVTGPTSGPCKGGEALRCPPWSPAI